MKDAMRIDLVAMKKAIRQTSFILLIMVVCAGYGMSSVSSAVAMAAAAAPYFFVITAFSQDAFQGWGRYRAMLPLTRKDVVGGRYLVELALSLTVAVVASVAGIAFQGIGWACGLLDSAGVAESVIEILAAGLASFAIIMIVVSIVMPICFKTGLTRASMVLPAIMVVAFIAVPALLGHFFGPFELDGIMSMLSVFDSPQGIMLSALLALAVMAAAYYASYKVSCRVFASRDL